MRSGNFATLTVSQVKMDIFAAVFSCHARMASTQARAQTMSPMKLSHTNTNCVTPAAKYSSSS